MENEPELIRDQMQETRTALSEKLEALEHQVTNTVQSATSSVVETVQSVKSAVSDTVDAVKGSVEGTVSSVKETVAGAFDLSAHFERHPWVTLLGSVAVGYVGGRLLHRGESREVHEPRMSVAPPSRFAEMAEPAYTPQTNGGSRKAEPSAAQGMLSGLMDIAGGELDKLKAVGLSALTGVVRDLLKQSVSGEIGSRLGDWVDGVTRKMGAQPLSQPILPQREDTSEDGLGATHGSGGNPANGPFARR